jgi:flavin reductase (DIM6/NTAB) family NADH-FMN oxidoreductase RutF
VVNNADSALAGAVDRTAGEFDPDIDEFQEAGLTPLPGMAVDAPRVAEAPVSLECTLLHSFRVGEGVGSSTLAIGEIRLFHLRDGLLNGENYHVDIGELDPLARLAGKTYARFGERFSVQDER